MELKTYNRWGQIVFESTTQASGWDGKWKGSEQEMGIYTYLLQVCFDDEEKQLLQGNITLIR